MWQDFHYYIITCLFKETLLIADVP